MDDLTRHLLARITHGETYMAAVELAGLFLDDDPSQYPREALARHLVALCSNRHGSFNWATDTLDMVEEWRTLQGLPARRVASETTVRRHLKQLDAAAVEDLTNGLLRRLFTIGVARGELRDGYDLVMDETAWPFYGLGRQNVSQKARTRDGETVPREALRTEASRHALPMPPDKFHATRKGFPFQVLAARFASKRTVPLAYVRRRPGVAESTGAAVEALLTATAGLPPPRWILADKWYNSADSLRLIKETLQRNGWTRTRFLVPVTRQVAPVERKVSKTQRVTKRGSKPRLKPRQKSPVLRLLGAIAQREYATAQPVTPGPEGNRFAVVRDWKPGNDERARCHVLFYYRPKWRLGGWVMDWEDGRSWIGFFTNAEPTPETVYAISRAYSARWGIEILNKRDHGFMGLSKAQKMHPRDITYGFGLVLSALENAARTQVLLERRQRRQATRRGRRRVVRTHEVLGDLDRQARGLGPVPDAQG